MIPYLIVDLGTMAYAESWEFQKNIVSKIQVDPTRLDQLVIVEHPEVITVGRGFQGENKDAFEIERGGEATLHNLGQLVFYPILRLRPGERDIHGFLRKLEEVLILTMNEWGISAERRPGATGVWVDKGSRKIASIGIAVSKWVTYHGCALNVDNDLTAFRKINPCGFDWSVMTSITKETGRVPSRQDVVRVFCGNFEIVLGRRVHCGAPGELLSSLEYG